MRKKSAEISGAHLSSAGKSGAEMSECANVGIGLVRKCRVRKSRYANRNIFRMFGGLLFPRGCRQREPLLPHLWPYLIARLHVGHCEHFCGGIAHQKEIAIPALPRSIHTGACFAVGNFWRSRERNIWSNVEWSNLDKLEIIQFNCSFSTNQSCPPKQFIHFKGFFLL